MMDRRSLLKGAIIAPFVRAAEIDDPDDNGETLEIGDVVYAASSFAGYGSGLAMIIKRSDFGGGRFYSVTTMPGSRLNKMAWWNRNELALIERGPYYRALKSSSPLDTPEQCSTS